MEDNSIFFLMWRSAPINLTIILEKYDLKSFKKLKKMFDCNIIYCSNTEFKKEIMCSNFFENFFKKYLIQTFQKYKKNIHTVVNNNREFENNTMLSNVIGALFLPLIN